MSRRDDEIQAQFDAIRVIASALSEWSLKIVPTHAELNRQQARLRTFGVFSLSLVLIPFAVVYVPAVYYYKEGVSVYAAREVYVFGIRIARLVLGTPELRAYARKRRVKLKRYNRRRKS